MTDPYKKPSPWKIMDTNTSWSPPHSFRDRRWRSPVSPSSCSPWSWPWVSAVKRAAVARYSGGWLPPAALGAVVQSRSASAANSRWTLRSTVVSSPPRMTIYHTGHWNQTPFRLVHPVSRTTTTSASPTKWTPTPTLGPAIKARAVAALERELFMVLSAL